jgi:hypothetical protein
VIALLLTKYRAIMRRRSGRARIEPVAFWKNESPVFKPNDNTDDGETTKGILVAHRYVAKDGLKASALMSKGEMAVHVERLLDLAQRELDQDPYRGILSANSPWSQCQVVGQIDAFASPATRKVSAACSCTCPSLVHWTEQHDAEQSKRRKRKRNRPPIDVLGHRPLEQDFQCACDFNPVSDQSACIIASFTYVILSFFCSLLHLLCVALLSFTWWCHG